MFHFLSMPNDKEGSYRQEICPAPTKKAESDPLVIVYHENRNALQTIQMKEQAESVLLKVSLF
jgi:hypothetical protein